MNANRDYELVQDAQKNVTSLLPEEYSWSIVKNLTVCAVCLVLDLYLAVRLGYSEHRKRTKRRNTRRAYDSSLRIREKQRGNRSPSEIGRQLKENREKKVNKDTTTYKPQIRKTRRDNSTQQRSKRWMTRLCILAPAFNIVSSCLVITKLVDMQYGQTAAPGQTTALCTGWLVFFIYLSNTLSRTSSLGFLWFRQWLFYCNPTVSMILYSPVLIWVSRLAGVILLIVGTLFFVAPTVNNALNGMFDVCWPLLNSQLPPDVVPPIQIFLMFFFQVLLLVLFIYPFVKRELRRYRASKGGGRVLQEPVHKWENPAVPQETSLPDLKVNGRDVENANGDQMEKRVGAGNHQETTSDDEWRECPAGQKLPHESSIQYTRSPSCVSTDQQGNKPNKAAPTPMDINSSAKPLKPQKQTQNQVGLSDEEAQETAAVRRAVVAVVIYIASAVGFVMTSAILQSDFFITGVSTQIAFTVVGNYCIVLTYATWKRIFFGRCVSKSRAS